MSTYIDCPSGLAGHIRGLKGKEAKLLADRSAARAGSTFDRILANCWLETADSGIYDFADGVIDWSKVLVADRFYALLQIRTQTFGNDYSFAVQCPSAICRERFEWTLNLQDLPVFRLSETSLAAFKAGNRFQTTLPRDGRKVWFRLMTGADEVRAGQVLKARRDDALLAACALRIVQIEDVHESAKRTFLEEMELADTTALLERFDAADGGVETKIEIECPACLGIWELQLPFDAGFFLPTSKGKPNPPETARR